MKNQLNKLACLSGVQSTVSAVALACATMSGSTHAAGYIFAGESFGLDIITHPQGYNGTGGNLVVNVCIVPGSPNASLMEIPTQNVINTWNAAQAVIPNLVNGSPDMAFNEYDYESVALHEVGHCIGAAHSNLGSQGGVSGVNTEYTHSTDGANNSYAFNSGADTVIGSLDDQRGDDQNLHWFDMASNDPFNNQAVVDSSTFSRSLSDLPAGHSFAANGSSDLATLLGYASSEVVMQQGTFNQQAQRDLAADDVHFLRLGMSGVDETAGTPDDYTLQLQYQGITATNCDINIRFQAGAGFASCSTSAGSIGGSNHWRISTANIFFDPNVVNWFFNQVSNGSSETCNGLPVTVDLSLGQTTTSGPDVVWGTDGADDIRGKGGDDTICGRGGDDFIHGNSGDDWIDGGDGIDNIRGGQGLDIIFTGAGGTVGTGSRAFGGYGDDEITGGPDADDLRGGRGVDIINGNGGADILYGNDDADVLNGNGGNDTINGGLGDDTLNGGADNDTLNGGAQTDICDGGSGASDTANASCETILNVP